MVLSIPPFDPNTAAENAPLGVAPPNAL